MAFVHGHARATGWVVAHRRRPNDAEEGQLPLLAVEEPAPAGSAVCPADHPAAFPSPRSSSEADESLGTDVRDTP